MLFAAFAIVTAFAAPVTAGAAAWQAEPGMIGTQYVGRVPAGGGPLMIKDWRSDGGMYVSDDLKAVMFYSNETRIGVGLETFRHREADGVAAWEIANFLSAPANRETSFVSTDCGLGPDFEVQRSATEFVVAIVDGSKAPGEELFTDGIVAAVQVDLKAGILAPIAAANVYCIQPLGD